jgi:hypothetical protein
VNRVRESTVWLRRASAVWWSGARRGCALLALGVACSCAPTRIPPPESPPPRAGHPADAIPGDLDVVFRFELESMREFLGPSATELLNRRGSVGADARDFVVAWALNRADTAWLAIRPGLPVDLTDNVLVLRGRLSGLERNLSPSWGRATDLGGGWFRYAHPRPSTRSAPARLYFHVNDLLVVVSTAEIDSTERALERGAPDPKLRPPDRGTVSAAVRPPPIARLIEARSPHAAQMLRQARELSAMARLSAAGLTAELNIEFDIEADATRAAEAMRLLMRAIDAHDALPRELTDSVGIETVGPTVTVRAHVPAETLRGLISCARSPRGCRGEATRAPAR